MHSNRSIELEWLLWCFPCEIWIVSSEVTEGSCFLENWSFQLEFLYNHSWSEVEIVLGNSNKVCVGHTFFDGTVWINMDRKWISESDSVRNLNQNSMGETIGNQRFSDISSIISSRSIDLGIIFSGESTSTMWAPSTIGVDNNFSSSQTGISSWSSNIEASRWVDNNLGVFEHISWYDLLNNFLGKSSNNLFVLNFWSVLSRDQDVIYSDWLNDTSW